MLAGGMRFFTYDLESVLPIRTWRELLFPVKGLKSVSGTPEASGPPQLAAPVLEQLREIFAAAVEPCISGQRLQEPSGSGEKDCLGENVLPQLLEKATGRELVNSTCGP